MEAHAGKYHKKRLLLLQLYKLASVSSWLQSYPGNTHMAYCLVCRGRRVCYVDQSEADLCETFRVLFR